jgi:hypothetical protein
MPLKISFWKQIVLTKYMNLKKVTEHMQKIEEIRLKLLMTVHYLCEIHMHMQFVCSNFRF